MSGEPSIPEPAASANVNSRTQTRVCPPCSGDCRQGRLCDAVAITEKCPVNGGALLLAALGLMALIGCIVGVFA